MKIGFYGNANNYPFMLARALMRRGHEVEFVVTSRDRLNRPECRYPDVRSPYPPWLHDLSRPVRWRWLLPPRGALTGILNRCDFLFLNEEGPAFARSLRVPYAAMLTGSNLEVFADAERVLTLLPSRWLGRAARRAVLGPLLLSPQRQGIRGAAFVTYFARGLVPNGDRMLGELGIDEGRRHFLLMTDLDLIPAAAPPQNPRLRTFCATRLVWRSEPAAGLTSLDYKGSDVMVRGLAEFWRRTGRRLDIHLVRKGRHAADTGALAAQLGIGDQVTWHDEMTQAEVLEHYRGADVVFEQLSESVVAMAGLDAMATGRPVIANWRPEVLDAVLGEPAPVCQASTPGDVCGWLERLVDDAALRNSLGQRGRSFVERHFSSDAAAASCLERIHQCLPARK